MRAPGAVKPKRYARLDRHATWPPAFDLEAASRRGIGSTLLAVVGVLATGASTLILIQGAAADATRP